MLQNPVTNIVETTALPSFSILFLGDRGSGKTTYFTVMTHELEINNPHIGFSLFLNNPPGAHQHFASLYDQLVSQNEHIEATPLSFGIERYRYHATFAAQTTVKHPLLEVEYVDYQGSLEKYTWVQRKRLSRSSSRPYRRWNPTTFPTEFTLHWWVIVK